MLQEYINTSFENGCQINLKTGNWNEENLLLKDLNELSNKLNKSYGYGKGTADAFKLCGVNRLCDIVDRCDDILLKIELPSLGISPRQRSFCKQCIKSLKESRKSDVLRLISKSRITEPYKNHDFDK